MPPEDHPHLLVARLTKLVDWLAGVIGPRHLGKPQTIDATLGLIQAELTGDGYTVERQSYLIDGLEAVNLIAEIPGAESRTDPGGDQSAESGAEIVLLGAHYDTEPTTPGADDNASAVAVLLAVAGLLKGQKFRHTVRFVAFACEEQPYFHSGKMGSQVYAQRCRERGETIRGMLCLEMVGYFTSAPQSQTLPPGIPRWLRWAFPSRGNFLAAIGNFASWKLVWQFRRGFKRGSRLPLFSMPLPESISEIRRSDNSSFWDQNYPALMLTDTLDYESMAEVALGVAGAVRHLACPVRR